MTNDEKRAEEYALGVEWRGDDYGERKRYYVEAYLAGAKDVREELTASPKASRQECARLREENLKMRDALEREIQRQEKAEGGAWNYLVEALAQLKKIGEGDG